jgi:uncharacterized membrane protein
MLNKLVDKIKNSKRIYWVQHSNWGFLITIVPLVCSVIIGGVMSVLGHTVLGSILFFSPIVPAIILSIFLKDIRTTDEKVKEDRELKLKETIKPEMTFKSLFYGKVDLTYIVVNFIIYELIVGITAGMIVEELNWSKFIVLGVLIFTGLGVWFSARIQYEKKLLIDKVMNGK